MEYRVLILQQSEWQQPGKLLLQAAKDNKIQLYITKVWKQSATNFADFDALIILGGPFCIDQDNQYPFLKEEKRLVRAWMNINKPCLGFNVGYHLLAEAAGATIDTGNACKKGFVKAYLTHEGKAHPLFQGIDTHLTLFKWQMQEIKSPLPNNMIMLATSKDCMTEAFCIEGRSNIIGLQCDNYAGAPKDVALWGKYDREQFADGLGRLTEANLIKTASRLAAEIAASFSLLMKNFVSMFER